MKTFWFILTALFWVGMNLLLWRSEYGGGAKGNPLPLETVISKILETPDPSELDIYYKNQPVGHCRWFVHQLGAGQSGSNEVAETSSGEVDLEAAELSAMIQDIRNYAMNLDGYLQWPREIRRVRFMAQLLLRGDRSWESFEIKVGLKDQWLKVVSNQKSSNLKISYEDGDFVWSDTYTLKDLEHPSLLLKQDWIQKAGLGLIAAPVLAALETLGDQMSQIGRVEKKPLSGWSAFSDWITVTHSRIRVYRVDAAFSNQLPVNLLVNRAGEILTLTLPQRVVLKNESIPGL